MTKKIKFALKIKGSGREGGSCDALRPCHPPKIWNVHQSPDLLTILDYHKYQEIHIQSLWVLDKIPSMNRSVFNMSSTSISDYILFSILPTFAMLQTKSSQYFNGT